MFPVLASVFNLLILNFQVRVSGLTHVPSGTPFEPRFCILPFTSSQCHSRGRCEWTMSSLTFHHTAKEVNVVYTKCSSYLIYFPVLQPPLVPPRGLPASALSPPPCLDAFHSVHCRHLTDLQIHTHPRGPPSSTVRYTTTLPPSQRVTPR